MIYCPQCGAEHPDKYEAALCCDQLRPGETEEGQFRRLFADELEEFKTETEVEVTAKVRAELAEAAKPPDIPALAKNFKLGDLLRNAELYPGRELEVFMVHSTGISTVATGTPLSGWAPRIEPLNWFQINKLLKAGELVITRPKGKFKLRSDLNFIKDNLKRIEKETGVKQKLHMYE